MFASRPRTAGSVTTAGSFSPQPIENRPMTYIYNKTGKSNRKAERSKSAGYIPHHSKYDQKRLSKNQSFDISSWLSEKSAKGIQEKTEYESSSVRNLYNTLLENETELIEGVEDYLAENEELQRRKKFLLLRDWKDNVYSPLKAGLDREMESRNYKRLDRGKREIYKEYLDYSNRKGNVFLDTISYEEYDPLALNGHRPGPLKVVTRKSRDPLLFQASKRNEEQRVVIACDTGLNLTDREIENYRLPPLPLVPLGRHGTECGNLLAMELTDIQSEARLRSQRRMLGIRTNSDIDFEVWQNIPVDADLIDKELHSQKRRQFHEKHQSTIILT